MKQETIKPETLRKKTMFTIKEYSGDDSSISTYEDRYYDFQNAIIEQTPKALRALEDSITKRNTSIHKQYGLETRQGEIAIVRGCPCCDESLYIKLINLRKLAQSKEFDLLLVSPTTGIGVDPEGVVSRSTDSITKEELRYDFVSGEYPEHLADSTGTPRGNNRLYINNFVNGVMGKVKNRDIATYGWY